MEPLNENEIKQKFSRKIPTKAIMVPIHLMKTLNNECKDFLLNLPKKPAILKEISPENCKKVILSVEISKTPFENWPKKLQNFINSSNLKLEDHDVLMGYDDFTYLEVMQELLPKDVVIPTGFETVGTIAHLNLAKNQLLHKKMIAQVLLDKNPAIKTVVNKTEALSNVFRTPELEILAGVNSLETDVKEGKCIFKLSYDKVYWNSKLQAERDRMLEIFKPTDVLLDLFCGVGPLSVRAAKKGCFVVANDLNPHCYDYLKINVEKNNVGSGVLSFNMDARECFYKVVDKAKNEVNEKIPQKFKHFQHIYMNLPGDAVSFLDMFFGFLKKADLEFWNEKQMPLIHVYSFSDSDETKSKDLLTQRITALLPNFTSQDMIHFHTIKDVSVHKKMFGITFRLKREDALGIIPNKDEKHGKKVEEKGESQEEEKKELEELGDKITKKIKKD